MARAWEASGLDASLLDPDSIREASLFRDDPSSPAIPLLDPEADLFPDADLFCTPGVPSGTVGPDDDGRPVNLFSPPSPTFGKKGESPA